MERGRGRRALARQRQRRRGRGSGARHRCGARRTPGGDVLLAVDGRPVTSPQDVVGCSTRASGHAAALHRPAAALAADGRHFGRADPVESAGLYFMLASVGIFSLLVGASVRLRRPDHQATLHFFWLTVAFFGVLAFSFTGRLDRPRLGVLLGGPDGAAAAPAALPALRAGLSRSGPKLGASDTGRTLAAADLSAGAAPRRGIGRAWSTRRAHGDVLRRASRSCSNAALALPRGLLVAGLAS